jgi:uncharacterized protein YbaP (TraB family)
MRLLFTLLFLLFQTPAALAQCAGQNLLDSLPQQQHDDLLREARAQAHSTGNFWRATRGRATLILAGTYHLGDPRHDAVVTALLPYLSDAKTLLVEAGPAEEEALRLKMAGDPTTMMAPAGSGLEASLAAEEWQQLTAALLARGIPSSLAQKLRPWFISVLLAIPPCALQLAAEGDGLDNRLIEAATVRSIPIRAMEPFDTALSLFDDLTAADQLTMIRSALMIETQAADYLQTTADAYFSQESRLVWELNRVIAYDLPGTTRAETDAEFARMEEAMIAARNRHWMIAIETAVKDGPAFAAFGALHLSGREGVLALLEQRGFTLERLPI